MSKPFRPTSVQLGIREPDLLIEGIPAHMRSAIAEWLMGWLDNHDSQTGTIAAYLMNLGRVSAHICWEESKRTGNHEQIRLADAGSLVEFIKDGGADARVLDILGAAIRHDRGPVGRSEVDRLRSILEQGGSKWTVGPTGRTIETRVSQAESDAYLEVLKPADGAAKDLAEAWNNTYGVHPDPSDAWDHAIKAVEWLLKPVTTPTNDLATLGNMLKAMKDKPEKWAFKLDTTDPEVTPVRTMMAMMGLVWGNPDRHGAGNSRPPTQEEAEAIVRMAVNVVGLLRTGTLVLQ